MRALAGVTLLALTGCNAIFGLDPTSSGGDDDDDDMGVDGAPVCPTPNDPGFFDEDSDLIADQCDRCPTIPDPEQPDADQDGVGDACDLTNTPTRIAFFDGFHGEMSPAWQSLGLSAWSTSGDALVHSDGTDASGIDMLIVKD